MYWQPEHHQCNPTVSTSGASWVSGKSELAQNKRATAPQSHLTKSVPQSTWQRHEGFTVSLYPAPNLDTSKFSTVPSAVKPDMKVQIFLFCLSLPHRADLQREGWWQRSQKQCNKSKLKQAECPQQSIEWSLWAFTLYDNTIMCYTSGICPTATQTSTAQLRVAVSQATPPSTPAVKHLPPYFHQVS